MLPRDFEAVLSRVEADTLDFKASHYNLTDEGSRVAFVKDVVCMANTPRDVTSYSGVHES